MNPSISRVANINSISVRAGGRGNYIEVGDKDTVAASNVDMGRLAVDMAQSTKLKVVAGREC